MSSSKSLSISDLFFTSPCPNIWLLLLLPMFSDQACQMALIFGLGLTLFHGGISFLHVCIEVLRHFSCFWASATAVEPRSSTEVCLTWGPPCRNRHQCRAPPCQGHLCSDPLGYLSLFIMCSPTCTGQGIQSHHIAPASEGGFPEQVQPPPRVGPHQGGFVQTHHVTYHFLLVWQSRQRQKEMEADCCQVRHGRSRVMERWT